LIPTCLRRGATRLQLAVLECGCRDSEDLQVVAALGCSFNGTAGGLRGSRRINDFPSQLTPETPFEEFCECLDDHATARGIP